MLTSRTDQPGILSGSVAHPFLSTRSASPLNGLQGSRAVLFADRLDRSSIQVMAHCILPGTGHEVAHAARVGSKRSRQRLRLRLRPEQRHERVPDADLQRQQRMKYGL